MESDVLTADTGKEARKARFALAMAGAAAVVLSVTPAWRRRR